MRELGRRCLVLRRSGGWRVGGGMVEGLVAGAGVGGWGALGGGGGTLGSGGVTLGSGGVTVGSGGVTFGGAVLLTRFVGDTCCLCVVLWV